MVRKASRYSTPANTISAMLVTAKYWLVTWPVVNMWWPHTAIDVAAKPMIASTNGP